LAPSGSTLSSPKKKATIERLYSAPPADSVVLCLDEMGPESAQSYPGVEPLRTAPGPGQPAGRARQEIDYGRRGKGYIFGAFEPGDGRALTLPYPGRTTANWVDFLQAVDAWIGPEPQAVFAIVDNLSTHRAADVLLFRAGLPALAVCLPAHLCGLPQPDRTLVENVTALSAQRPPL
jgi:DDE superfamily endonuclease